jgi:hypothetical protein
MGLGLQRALNVSPWRENALMVDMTTFASPSAERDWA